MKQVLLLAFILAAVNLGFSQQRTSYQKPIQKAVYSTVLKDTVNLEIIIPKGLKLSNYTDYPVIYLFDRQNGINYDYNLHTIEYLTSVSAMPRSIIIGISLDNRVRGKWTNPNISGGKADDFIRFLTEEFYPVLKEDYPVSSFNLMIGHSRTAIFSSYALSKKYDFFNGAIASSTSNFDFGKENQQLQFEEFLDTIASAPHDYYLYFSTGEKKYGDGHEPRVDIFNAYLLDQKLPGNFHWKYYKESVGHYVIPGLTVNRALSEIFTDYRDVLRNCFKIVNDSTYADNVPWEKYLDEYSLVSKRMGYPIHPDLTFFNSIASSYVNDYNNLFQENKFNFAIFVLLEAIKTYPNDYDLSSWIGELYMTQGDSKNGMMYLNKTIELINNNENLSKQDKENKVKEVTQNIQEEKK
jgi:predicted alpha/beta superfamily hydrolase